MLLYCGARLYSFDSLCSDMLRDAFTVRVPVLMSFSFAVGILLYYSFIFTREGDLPKVF